MANPLPRATPTNVVSTRGNALSGAATGVVLTYTVPAGRVALLRSVTVDFTNLAPTVAVQLVAGATTFNLTNGTANYAFLAAQWLQAGEKIVINVTTAVAASTFDGVITADEYEAQ